MSAQAEAPKPAPLPVVAVSQVRADPNARLPTYFSAYGLTREIEGALDSTRKFRVASRSAGESEAFADEAAFMRKNNAAVQKADFLIAIEVVGVDVGPETRPIPNLRGKSSTRTLGRIEMRVTVLDAKTRAVQSRFPIEARLQGDPVVHDYDAPPGEAAASLGFVDLAKVAGRRLADRVLDEVFPVRVIQRQSDVVYLNRGEDSGYTIGETLRVYSGAGERLRDPYTGEDLGPAETLIGTVRVTELRPRLTMAQVVSETSPIGAGAIIRKPSTK